MIPKGFVLLTRRCILVSVSDDLQRRAEAARKDGEEQRRQLKSQLEQMRRDLEWREEKLATLESAIGDLERLRQTVRSAMPSSIQKVPVSVRLVLRAFTDEEWTVLEKYRAYIRRVHEVVTVDMADEVIRDGARILEAENAEKRK